MTVPRITPDLDGVPETLLWPLRSRAGLAVTDRSFFDDPMAVDLYNRIDYDFARFGPVTHWHAVRSNYSDGLIRDFLARHPDAQIVALGEGLETQLWRVDNGRLDWICVDLPESIALRRRLLPEHPRLTEMACSALSPDWLEALDPDRGTFITAAGLLMYFTESETAALFDRIAKHGGGAKPGGAAGTEIFFDTIPRWLSRRTIKGAEIDHGYIAPQMPFGTTRRALNGFADTIEGFRILSAMGYADPYPERARFLWLMGHVPILRQMMPLLVHGGF